MTHSILLTGGSGKTAGRIRKLLQAKSLPLLVASTRGKADGDVPAVKFDWFDQSTYANPFAHPLAQSSPIKAVYLVIPSQTTEAVEGVLKFIELARGRGVERFVLLSASPAPAGGPGTGKVHAFLQESGLAWTVLRPTWFNENFLEAPWYQEVAKSNAIFSASEDGRIPFVSSDDIAAIGARALADEKPHNREYLVLGPELLSYDDVAAILSETLGRTITHKRLTPEDFTQRVLNIGAPADAAAILAYMETQNAKGAENRLNDDVEKVLGRKAITFRTFAAQNKDNPIWKAA